MNRRDFLNYSILSGAALLRKFFGEFNLANYEATAGMSEYTSITAVFKLNGALKII